MADAGAQGSRVSARVPAKGDRGDDQGRKARAVPRPGGAHLRVGKEKGHALRAGPCLPAEFHGRPQKVSA